MKKLYTLSFILLTTLSFGQSVLQETFNYTVPGNVGGSTTTASDAVGSNNWATHSNTVGLAGSIDVINGSLTYAGLSASSGNKVLLPGSNATVARDINRPIITTSTSLYYSALVNVIDNTQLSATAANYFMGFGASAGASVTTLGARLGITSSNTAANYRLSILNTSGGATIPYTENASDLNFGTTYLVVVKYDISTTPTTATLWVNPTSLGGIEPAATVTNNVGTTAFTTFGSIVLRNAGTTPKVEIDEIRVGTTFASVTPTTLATKQNTISGLKVYTTNNNLYITSDSSDVKSVLVYNILGKNVIKTSVNDQAINVSDLASGIYIVKVTENGKSNTVKVVIK